MFRGSDRKLQIKLKGNHRIYHPGDEISGIVHLNLEKDSSIGTICVSIYGKVKSKIVRRNGQSSTTYHGRSDLFRTRLILQSDKFTYKSGDYEYPFKFELPQTDQPKSIVERWDACDGFLSNVNNPNPNPNPLPPSMRIGDSRFEAAVIYGIEVAIVPPSETLFSQLRSRRWKEYITLLPPPSPEPLDFTDLAQRRDCARLVAVSTFKLLPGNAENLSLKQSFLTTFGSSKVPKFSYSMGISYNSLLELGSNTPIPFIITALAKIGATCTTIEPAMMASNRYPDITIRAFELKLEIITKIRCPSMFGDRHKSEETTVTIVSRRFMDLKLSVPSVASDQMDDSGNCPPPFVDLGRECNACIGTGVPSFVSYNVSRKYYLFWKLEVECAGEKETIRDRSSQEVTLLGPSASRLGEDDAEWANVPPEDMDSEEGGQSSQIFDKEKLPQYSRLPEEGTSTVTSMPKIGNRTTTK